MSPVSELHARMSVATRYLASVAIFAVALALRFALLPIEDRLAFLTFYPAAVLAFYLTGFGPGLLMVGLSAVAGLYIFTPPHWSWSTDRSGYISVATFLLSAGLIGWAVRELQQTALRLAASNRKVALLQQAQQATLDQQSDVICRIDVRGLLLYVNPAFCRMAGRTGKELIGSDWHPVAHPEDQHIIDVALASLRPDRPVVTVENRVVTADNGLRWMQFLNHATFDGQGRLLDVLGVGRDITARKDLEAALARATDEIQDLYQNAPCGYHSLGPDGRFMHINATELNWLGCSLDEAVGKLGPADFFTRQGRSRFAEEFPKLVRGEATELVMEQDLIGFHGASRKVQIRATAVCDAQGRFIRSRSVLSDITELHETRAALQRVGLEQVALLDNELIGIMRLNERRILWSNRGMVRLFGYTESELNGQSTRLLYQSDESFRAIGHDAYADLAVGRRHRVQVEMRRKDGTPIWIDQSGEALGADGHDSIWLYADITAMKRYERQVEQLAFFDALTGLPNRRLLADRMEQSLALAAREHVSLVVCYLDLNGFKPINDRFGHGAGDHLLRTVAQRLRHAVREHDTVARVGGDEFVLLLNQLPSEDCTPIVERVLAAIELPIPLIDGKHQAHVSASLGVAHHPTDGTTADALIRHADAAMYAVKRALPPSDSRFVTTDLADPDLEARG
jgi:diguanylate cyclase (GGDEF)-like protein/PAS domain S-box-containing protein